MFSVTFYSVCFHYVVFYYVVQKNVMKNVLLAFIICFFLCCFFFLHVTLFYKVMQLFQNRLPGHTTHCSEADCLSTRKPFNPHYSACDQSPSTVLLQRRHSSSFRERGIDQVRTARMYWEEENWPMCAMCLLLVCLPHAHVSMPIRVCGHNSRIGNV